MSNQNIRVNIRVNMQKNPSGIVGKYVIVETGYPFVFEAALVEEVDTESKHFVYFITYGSREGRRFRGSYDQHQSIKTYDTAEEAIEALEV